MATRRPSATVVLISCLLIASACERDREAPDSPPAEDSATETPALVASADSEVLVQAFREGAAALGAGEFAAAARAFDRALAANPGDEVSTYLGAAAAALSGDQQGALEGLHQLAALGSDLIPRQQTFASLQGSPRFEEAMAAIQGQARRCGGSEIAFNLAERDLFPEGIAYDPVDDAFFLGSLYKAKVVRVAREAGGLRIGDFLSEGQDGLYSVLGMKVDPGRRLLWLASSADPPYRGFDEADRGKVALYAFDLANADLRHRFAIEDNEPPHIFNDLDVSASGEVYVTDSATGEIYHVDPDGGRLDVLLPAGTFERANGIALSDDDSKLFVASWAEGISMVDLATLRNVRLRHPKGVSTQGPDGIYFYNGSLFAVYNAVGPGRVVRFWLDETRTEIHRAEILECNHPLFGQPTTGALAPDGFYFIANSQFTSFDPNNEPLPLEQLREITVLRIPY